MDYHDSTGSVTSSNVTYIGAQGAVVERNGLLDSGCVDA